MSTKQPTDPAASADSGLFGPESVTWRVNGDPSAVLGGVRALLLQSCHPAAMAGFAGNSAYRSDPWGRLQRTGEWVATITYGTTAQAEQAGERLRALHRRLTPGVEPESGRAWRVDDPDLLLWVHCAEVDSFLSTYQRCGGALSPAQADRYVDEQRQAARLVGLDVEDVPRSEQELADYFVAVQPELKVTKVARDNLRWSITPPMPRWVTLATPARPAWVGLVTLSFALLPRWARRLYGLPALPTTDLSATLAARALRQGIVRTPGNWYESPALRAARERVAA